MNRFGWLLAIPVAVVLIACAAPTPSNSSGGGTQVEGASTTFVATPEVTASSAAPVQIAATPAAPAGPFTAFKAGTYEVGTGAGQVKPGKYKTTVPAGIIAHCYWERLSALDGDFGSILANGNLMDAGTPGIITIKASDKGIRVSGDCEWKIS